jgi:hypothetical protein
MKADAVSNEMVQFAGMRAYAVNGKMVQYVGI